MVRFSQLATILPLLLLVACSSQPAREATRSDFTIDELKQRAEYANEAGAHAEALAGYTKILSKDPENMESLIGAGETLLAIGKPERAGGYFIRALALQPKNIDAREGRALAWLMAGSYVDARMSLKNLVEDGVERWRVWNALGIIDDLFGDYADAVSNYRRAIQLAPERTMLQNNLGYSLLMNREYSQAESVLDTALKAAPTNARIVNNLAMSIAWQGRYEEAVNQLQLVMGEAEANNNAGYVAYLAGDYSEAEAMFKKALRLKPSYYKRAAKNLELVHKKR